MTKTEATNDHIMRMLAQFAQSVDERFERIDERFDKMFVYNEKRFAAIEKKLENMATKDDIRRIETTLYGYAQKIDAYAAEMAAMQHKIDRLERALKHIAEQTDISLEEFGV